MVNLLLQDLLQDGPYRFNGKMKLADVADAFRDYPFDDEVKEKALIQRSQMEAQGFIPDFSLTLRVEPQFKAFSACDTVLCQCIEYELIDGKSKAAAVAGLAPDSELLTKGIAYVQIFAVTREKMASLTGNRP